MPFKIQLMQELSFAEWALGKLAEDTLSCRKVVLSDEAYFWLNRLKLMSIHAIQTINVEAFTRELPAKMLQRAI